eukprot:gene21872-36464_t
MPLPVSACLPLSACLYTAAPAVSPPASQWVLLETFADSRPAAGTTTGQAPMARVSGRVSDQKNLAILAAGYTAPQQGEFDGRVDRIVQFLQNGDPSSDGFLNSQPYKRYYNAMNIFSVFQPSRDAGASKPWSGVKHGQRGRSVTNNLDCTYGVHTVRALSCHTSRVLQLASHAPAADLMLVLICTVSAAEPLVPGGEFLRLVQHELGHADALLADEYDK